MQNRFLPYINGIRIYVGSLISLVFIMGGVATGCTSNNASNLNQTSSAPTSVTERVNSDTVASDISNIKVTSVTDTEAIITWTTSKPSSSQVYLGKSIPYNAYTKVAKTLVNSHSVKLTYLKPSTLYHFKVVSQDAEGNGVNP